MGKIKYVWNREGRNISVGEISYPEIKDFLILNSKKILQGKHTIGQHSIHYLSISSAESSSFFSITISQDLLSLPQFVLFIPFLTEVSSRVWGQVCICSYTQEISILTSYFYLQPKNRRSKPIHFKITLVPNFLIFLFI